MDSYVYILCTLFEPPHSAALPFTRWVIVMLDPLQIPRMSLWKNNICSVTSTGLSTQPSQKYLCGRFVEIVSENSEK